MMTWIITEKLSEDPRQLTQKDSDDGLGPSFTGAKFLCHRADDPTKIAFMRIYLQVPIAGTEFQNSTVRAKQAAPPRMHDELMAFKAFKKKRCNVVPELLCYQEGVQDQDGIVPGGYVTYLLWDKVPGEPLNTETFWSLDLPSRHTIRAQFRTVYEELVRCGYVPCLATLSNIIFDKSTGKMHISGFGRACPIDPFEKWSDTKYILYRLAKRPACDSDITEWTW
ncbi:hypothetical protein CNMCM5793_003203 [Aspergillus hiratsukae]|uniref:Uncharacterized protein n=1 Tax=Aspergillus hiratsukae TaxID=1194566 RepID=A0A8H6UFA9_9EURO|nr:hypothetical protein CNMCM5793_003203 [Aspergillus hiratsukae]KAF7168170.1 hypothetical protein CNMCM6106_003460 [Aspergillus hiratsukae]